VRIVLIIYGSLQSLSGGYLYDRQLVASLERAGHSVQLLSLPWRNWPRHLADNLSRAWIEQLIDAAPDLYLQDELCHPSLAWVNGSLRRAPAAPIVALVHHLRSDEPHPAPQRRLYRVVERRYLQTCDAFLCNSRTTLNAVARLLRRPAESLQSLIAFPAGDHLPAPDVGALAAKRELRALREVDDPAGTPLRVLFLGALLPRKGLHTLLDAVAACPFPVQLEVVGDDRADRDYAQSIRAQVARLGLQQRVRLHGALPEAEVRRHLLEADLLAVPSFEGFGIVYLEAMAHGLPVIASSAGAAHEVVRHGETGFLVAPGDSAALAGRLEQLARDQALRATMSTAARLRYDVHPTWAQSGAAVAAWLPTVTRTDP
jgi:glycosyltransferase involved in cell wall biosynthesis